MRVSHVVVLLIVSVAIVAVALPLAMGVIAPLRDPVWGWSTAATLLVGSFLVLRRLWPPKRG